MNILYSMTSWKDGTAVLHWLIEKGNYMVFVANRGEKNSKVRID